MVAVVWPNGLTVEPRRSDPYGPRKPITTSAGTTRPFHVGGDWKLGGGKSHSILAGTVVEAEEMGALGLQVLVYVGVIDGHRYWVRTCHLKDGSLRVRVGDPVGAGTVLGIEGDTGLSVGVHTHIEVYRDGVDRGVGKDPGDTIDPRAFILSLFNRPAGTNNTSLPTPTTAPASSPEEDEMIPLRSAYFRGVPGTTVDTICVVNVAEHTFYRVPSAAQLAFIEQTAGVKHEPIVGVQSFDLIRGFREI